MGIKNRIVSGGTYYQLSRDFGSVGAGVAFQPNGSSTTTLQVAEYYPFGSSYTPLSPDNSNKYLYNGKEKQTDLLGSVNLDWYDYGARFYDPAIGRWHSVDPLAERHFHINQYHYVLNNPIRYMDFCGLDTIAEVVVIAKDLSRNYTFPWWMGDLMGSYNPYKERKADPYDEWLIRTFDQSMVRLFGEAFGDYAASPTLNNHVRSREYFHRPKETSDEEIMDEHGGEQETNTDATGKPIYKQVVDDENLRQYEGDDGTRISVYPSQNPTSNGKISSIDSLINNPASTVDTLFKHTPTGDNMKYIKSNFPFVNKKHGSAHGWRIPN